MVKWLNRNPAFLSLEFTCSRQTAVYFLWTVSNGHWKPLRLPMITKKYYVQSIHVAPDKKRVVVVVIVVLQQESEALAFSISLIGSSVQSNSTPPPLRLSMEIDIERREVFMRCSQYGFGKISCKIFATISSFCKTTEYVSADMPR